MAIKLNTSGSTPITTEDLQKHRQEVGWVGRALGGFRQAPVNVAAILAILGVVGMFYSATMRADAPITPGDFFKGMLGLTTSALAFLGGTGFGGSKNDS